MINVFSYYRRLDKVREFVDENLDEQISLADAAKVAGMSPPYFSTFFHDKVGMTFHEWLVHTRIRHAKKLLTEHNYSVTEVCYAVGFNSLWTFERAFKRYCGKTPKRFKNSKQPAP